MAARHISLLLILIIIKYAATKTRRVWNLHNNTAKDIKTHLDNPKVKLFCANRDVHCSSKDSKVCALRALNSTFTYKEFDNACFLFLSNMCDQPGKEFHIVGTGSCDHYLNIQKRNQDNAQSSKEFANGNNSENNNNNKENKNVENVDESSGNANDNDESIRNRAGNVDNSRENRNNRVEIENNDILNRRNDVSNVNNRRKNGNNSLVNVNRSNENGTNIDNSSENITKYAENENNNDENEDNNSHKKMKNITKIFRKRKKSSLRTYDTAYDNHSCPKACPETYSPVCVNVNRGYGKYFKMYTFLNHCKADFYYCNNTSEFDPPPDESAEMVDGSPLSWSYCAASRYLQFARFAEVTSSMGHYGWLSGNYGYSHIMEPQQRIPGYG